MEWPGGFALLGCQRAAYDLDLPIAIETDDPVALAALSAGVAELGGQVDPEARQAVRVVSECLCVGAATPGAQVAACTQSGVCLSLTGEQLVLRRCGYWLNLTDEPATENASGMTVHLRINQRFDPETLVRLMRLAARQERLI